MILLFLYLEEANFVILLVKDTHLFNISRITIDIFMNSYILYYGHK